jgi:hypothetical protein
MRFWRRLTCQILLVTAFVRLQDVSAATESPVLETFKLTCLSNGQSFEELKNSFIISSWEDKTDIPPTELSGLVKIFVDAKKKMPVGDGFDQVLMLSGKVGGRQLYAWLATLHTAGKNLVSCTLYDFEGTSEQFSSIDMNEYSDQSPEKKEVAGTITLRWLNPSKLDGYYAIKNSFVPKDSKLDALAGYHGISLSTTARKED